jgi:RecJ-like exonuclease
MKRLVATLSVVTALVVPAVATAPASASGTSIKIDGATITCENTSGGAVFTLEYGTFKKSSPAIPGLTCPKPPF